MSKRNAILSESSEAHKQTPSPSPRMPDANDVREDARRSRIFNKNRYLEKLQDPRWQKRRLEIFNRDNFKCQNCGESEKPLHLHHLAYSGDAWESPECDLITLCRDCHKLYEDRLKRFRKHIHKHGDMLDVVLEILDRDNLSQDELPTPDFAIELSYTILRGIANMAIFAIAFGRVVDLCHYQFDRGLLAHKRRDENAS